MEGASVNRPVDQPVTAALPAGPVAGPAVPMADDEQVLWDFEAAAVEEAIDLVAWGTGTPAGGFEPVYLIEFPDESPRAGVAVPPARNDFPLDLPCQEG